VGKTQEPSRREFLSQSGTLMLGGALSSFSMTQLHASPGTEQTEAVRDPQKARNLPGTFLYGASVYPELQTREEWNQMLDHFQRAQMNCVRVCESSWGNLETALGHFNFGWLQDFLDDLASRQMKAILGTSTFIPPQWLVGKHPETLLQPLPGYSGDPMSRKSACLNHPFYRQACGRYIAALGKEFKDHSAVIGWQLDNEIEFMVRVICYNPACEKAWQDWLQQTYHTPQEFNQRLDLVSWGMKIDSFDEVPQPRIGIESLGNTLEFTGSSDARRKLPALSLANFHFRRDVILGFLAEQAQALRRAGVNQPVLTDWNTVWTAIADDPKAGEFMDIAGLNYYQPRADNPEFWSNLTWHQDMHRSAYGQRHFITTENRFGVIGQTYISDPVPTHDQFRMWGLEAAAFGSRGLLYWTGNRWRGGHWPHWGGLLDWSGHPEPDFPWAIELGEFYRKWGANLIENPVRATAVVLTDFDQRAALEVYPHIKASLSVLPQTFEALHRLGIGVDCMNLASAADDPARLEKYSLVLIPAATALDGPRVAASLNRFVEGGGILVITPFTAYTDWNGIFCGDGFAANLKQLTGGLVRTIRWMGPAENTGQKSQEVEWQEGEMSGTSPVGLDGYCELMEVDTGVAVIAKFRSEQPILDAKPAVTRRKLGRGSVFKLGFWPADDSLLRLLRQLMPSDDTFLAAPLPAGVLAVPRADNSMFIINTTGKNQAVHLTKPARDRISGINRREEADLKPYEVLWLA
jgi:beta-galactosidase